MAFGFPPKFEFSIPLNNIAINDFIKISKYVAIKLQWQVIESSDKGFIAKSYHSKSSWSELITINIENDIAQIVSKSFGGQIIDAGRNKNNVYSFVEVIQDLVNDPIKFENVTSAEEVNNIIDDNIHNTNKKVYKLKKIQFS